jgi:hypothetical protein
MYLFESTHLNQRLVAQKNENNPRAAPGKQ